MKKLSILTGALLGMFMLNACDNEIPEQSDNNLVSDGGRQYIFTAGDFNWNELGESRSALNITPNGATFAWAEGDTIGIVPNEGSQVYFAIDPKNAGSNQAAFSGGAWGMKPGSEFAAYYPFVHDILLDRTKIPVDYTGQVLAGQTGGNLGDYDYMVARPQEANENGNVNFNFEHLGAIVWLEFTVPTPGAVKRLILSYNNHYNPLFPVTGTIDLTQDPIAITHTKEDMSNFISFDVENLTTTTENQKVSVYFMMPPVDLSKQTLGLTVVRGDGNDNIRLQVAGKNLLAQKPYKLTATEYQGTSYDNAIINMEDWPRYIEKYGTTRLRFVANSSLTVSGMYQYNGAPMYPVCNGEWLEIHTPAKEFKIQNGLIQFSPQNSYVWALQKEIDLSGIGNTESLTSMFRMFFDCPSLEKVTFGNNFNTSNVTSMSQMFYDCQKLQSVSFGENFNTESVTDMSHMFRGCSSLTSLDVSGFNTANVTNMNSMFASCTSLTSLDVSEFNTANVTNMGYMFYNCPSLTSLDVSGFNTENVISMASMFSNCSSLTSLDVSEFNTANVTYMNSMFYNCFSLTSLDVSGFNTANVTNMYSMFSHCASLTSLDVSGFNTANVTNMGYMFSNCQSLTSLDLSNFNTAKVNAMNNMFYYCLKLNSIDLSSFNTESVRIFYSMFNNCCLLSELDLSKFTFNQEVNINDIFYRTGMNRTDKPISIFVSTAGKTYLEGVNTGINAEYAKYVEKNN